MTYKYNKYSNSKKKSYSNSKNRYSNSKKRYSNSNSKKKSYSNSKPLLAKDLSGFDKAIYKTDKILGQVSHGFDVIGKPITGAINIAKDIAKNSFSALVSKLQAIAK